MGVAVGSRGYYSEVSGKKWVTPQTQTNTTKLKNNLTDKVLDTTRQGTTGNGLFRTKA